MLICVLVVDITSRDSMLRFYIYICVLNLILLIFSVRCSQTKRVGKSLQVTTAEQKGNARYSSSMHLYVLGTVIKFAMLYQGDWHCVNERFRHGAGLA